MPVTAGTRLGPYEILAPLGAGGMGEVYKARDTRLDRIVAIKVLTESLASDRQFRERFDREARTISQLDHPHICALYDVGEQDGTAYLVMQYLEGETLAARLAKGALPIAEALRIAIQIADALDKAHRAGIVHRDLKPGNVMLTKSGAKLQAKLLDFGLAKAGPVAGHYVLHGSVRLQADLSAVPTIPNLTAQGTILGTLQYMAPEQLEGKDADARTDVFAFGAVVYEMLAGRKAFEGTSQASLIGAILKDDPPPISRVQPLTPPALGRVVKKCLAKEPDERWQSANDLCDELKWIAETGPEGVTLTAGARAKIPHRAAWVASVLLALALIPTAAIVIRHWREPADAATVVRLQMPTTRMRGDGLLSISPDGRHVAYVASNADGRQVLWVRALDALTPRALTGTDGAGWPFWSPDSRTVAFVADHKLKKIDLTGGLPQTLCDVPGFFQGGSWNQEGTIVFATQIMGGLARVSAGGGSSTPALRVDPVRASAYPFAPSFLPDGDRFIYSIWTADRQKQGIYLASLRDGSASLLMASNSLAAVTAGHVLFVRDATLFARPFDAARGRFTGDPLPVVDQVDYDPVWGMSNFAASQNGVLVYRPGGARNGQLTWFDRNGTKQKVLGEAGLIDNFDLSRDGARVAVARPDPQTGGTSIWMIDESRNITAKMAAGTINEGFNDPVWSPDGQSITFTARQTRAVIMQQPINGINRTTLTPAGEQRNMIMEDWSRDGRYLAIEISESDRDTVAILPFEGDRKPIPVASSRLADEPHFSADGRWLSYNTDESGTSEVYVSPVPPTGEHWQVSTKGGAQARWRADGLELYYLALDGTLMAVDVHSEARSFQASAPHALFQTGVLTNPRFDQYAVSGDGRRFLINVPFDASALTPITVVLNWNAGLKK